ncbi:sce7726 family protein [Aliarcobacter butzleri]|uniref:sce7726 family protein n=1 Tax=Aliarcobacter butzleri TaxID=28197 RepID=UPI003B21E6F6
MEKKELYDFDIRRALINKLFTQSIKPNAIIEELRVHNGKAIADVVALYKEAHCYEIKSDVDNDVRLIQQSNYYDRAFRKITLVTTQKHLTNMGSKIPEHWGIMIAQLKFNNEIILKYIRKATNNRYFDKRVALKSLWKDELLSLNNQEKSFLRKDKLVEIISQNYKKQELSENISELLKVRDKAYFLNYT